MKYPRELTAALAAVLAGVSLAGCAAKETKQADTGGAAQVKVAPEKAQVTVNATDTACALSTTEGGTGPTTFVVTNNGASVTEFYVYGKDDRVLAEVENIAPGLQRQVVVQLTDAGTYRVACKPGMVGDGIRGDFTVKG